jgi:uncharacterized integral membrane protein
LAERPPETEQQGTTREQVRLVLTGALVLLVLLFAILNFDKVSVDLIFGSTDLPLVIVIVGCLLIGAAIDRLMQRRAARRRGG